MAKTGHPVIDHLMNEQEALFEKRPDWKADPKQAVAVRSGLAEHYGLDHQHIIPRHEYLIMGADALAARSLRSENERLKAQLVERKKVEAAAAKGQQRHEDFKQRLADVKRSPGGKQSRAEMIADYVDGEDGR